MIEKKEDEAIRTYLINLKKDFGKISKPSKLNSLVNRELNPRTEA